MAGPPHRSRRRTGRNQENNTEWGGGCRPWKYTPVSAQDKMQNYSVVSSFLLNTDEGKIKLMLRSGSRKRLLRRRYFQGYLRDALFVDNGDWIRAWGA